MQAAAAPPCAEVPGYMQTGSYLMWKSSKSMGHKKRQFLPKQKVQKVQDEHYPPLDNIAGKEDSQNFKSLVTPTLQTL